MTDVKKRPNSPGSEAEQRSSDEESNQFEHSLKEKLQAQEDRMNYMKTEKYVAEKIMQISSSADLVNRPKKQQAEIVKWLIYYRRMNSEDAREQSTNVGGLQHLGEAQPSNLDDDSHEDDDVNSVSNDETSHDDSTQSESGKMAKRTGYRQMSMEQIQELLYDPETEEEERSIIMQVYEEKIDALQSNSSNTHNMAFMDQVEEFSNTQAVAANEATKLPTPPQMILIPKWNDVYSHPAAPWPKHSVQVQMEMEYGTYGEEPVQSKRVSRTRAHKRNARKERRTHQKQHNSHVKAYLRYILTLKEKKKRYARYFDEEWKEEEESKYPSNRVPILLPYGSPEWEQDTFGHEPPVVVKAHKPVRTIVYSTIQQSKALNRAIRKIKIRQGGMISHQTIKLT